MKLTMIGRLSECVLLAYRTPAHTVRRLLPAPLELVTRDGWAFWNIVVCRVEKMRPRAAPRFAGISYNHLAYRLYARASTGDGETIDGLYFVRSDVDHAPTAWAGNLMTDFRFHRASIQLDWSADEIAMKLNSRDGADATLLARSSTAVAEPPALLKYRPIALACDRSARWLKLAEVVRDESAWRESAIEVVEAKWSLLEQLGQRDLHLESATRIAPIDYQWKLGRRLPLVPRVPAPLLA